LVKVLPTYRRMLDTYPDDARLAGIDFSHEMLDQARERADALGREVDLKQADAHDLPFPDATFDTVVCTFGLCAIPDHVTAVDEMIRVLRPGGQLILVDHVASTSLPLRALQSLLELVTVPLDGEHFLRRPHDQVVAAGVDLERAERFKLGIIERLTARKPAAN
jgi:ubiquinone/menaquinone biosynthesis C-methylase UbiE